MACEWTQRCGKPEEYLAQERQDGIPLTWRVCREHAGRFHRVVGLDGQPRFHGERLYLARTALGISRDDFAALVDTSEYALWQVETGKAAINDELLGRVLQEMKTHLGGFHPQYFFSPCTDFGIGSLALHHPNDVCQDCRDAFAEALCDARVNGQLCSRRLCWRCRNRPTPNRDLCRLHAGPVTTGRGGAHQLAL